VILDRILERKRREVDAAIVAHPLAALREIPCWSEPRRGFSRALRSSIGPAVIAEIKKASPSRGVIRRDFDPSLHARQYAENGATCLSVLTDHEFFQGRLEHLAAARRASGIPLLRKDFIINPYQITEARAWGADAVLLIVAALTTTDLASLQSVAAEHGLDVLVEIHDEHELEVALASGANLIGINNRDLHTFETTLDVTRRLAPRVPEDRLVVTESGIRSAADVEELRALGVRAFLVGEHLMAAPDPGAALASLIAP
jgi:indole-3-glycerol phosphate synthase